MRMDVEKQGEEDQSRGGMTTLGGRDCRGRRRKTGLCGGNLSDTSTPHRSGKRCGGRCRRLCAIERYQTSGMVSCVSGW